MSSSGLRCFVVAVGTLGTQEAPSGCGWWVSAVLASTLRRLPSLTSCTASSHERDRRADDGLAWLKPLASTCGCIVGAVARVFQLPVLFSLSSRAPYIVAGGDGAYLRRRGKRGLSSRWGIGRRWCLCCPEGGGGGRGVFQLVGRRLVLCRMACCGRTGRRGGWALLARFSCCSLLAR